MRYHVVIDRRFAALGQNNVDRIAAKAVRTFILTITLGLVLFSLPARATVYATPGCPNANGCFFTVTSPPTPAGTTTAYVELHSGFTPGGKIASQSISVVGNIVQVTATWDPGATFGTPSQGDYTVAFALPSLPTGSYTFQLVLSLDPSSSWAAPPVITSDGTVVPNASVFETLPFNIVSNVAIAPQPGLWWNPNESGTGYALDVKHGVVVATIYSFTTQGPPLWYLAFGPIDANNTMTGTLSKYADGQCISCSYVSPVENGSDGMVTIQFTSPTTATLTLPGRAPFTIVPQDF